MGGGVAMGGGGGHEKKGSLAPKRKKKKRVGFVLDLAPLVDIAFLLLSFFMFTTNMLQPQTMEMAIPREETEVEVRASELMSLYVRKDGKLFYKLGIDGEYIPVTLEKLGSVAYRENMRPGAENRLITALKISSESLYGRAVQVLDALNQAEVAISDSLAVRGMKRDRKFSIAPFTDKELEELSAL